MHQRVVDSCTDCGNLCGIALLGRSTGAVGIDFSGGLVGGVGDTAAQAQLLERILDNAPSELRCADDLAVVIGRSNMSDLLHRLDHRLLKLRLRVLAVIDQIEAIGNPCRLKRLAVAGRQRGT